MIARRDIYYFTPDDDAQTVFLNELAGAKISVRIAIYSFNLAQAAQLLCQLHQNGVDVSLVMDKSQSAGSTEVPEVAMLRQAGVPLVIGTSEDHKILHDKFTVIDNLTVLEGSYNYTKVAESESNVMHLVDDPLVAQQFMNNWQVMYNFITQNEAQG